MFLSSENIAKFWPILPYVNAFPKSKKSKIRNFKKILEGLRIGLDVSGKMFLKDKTILNHLYFYVFLVGQRFQSPQIASRDRQNRAFSAIKGVCGD